MKTTDFIDKLNAQNSKITVLGTYERNNSKIAVKCDICGWEWTPIPYSLLAWMPQVCESQAENPCRVC